MSGKACFLKSVVGVALVGVTAACTKNPNGIGYQFNRIISPIPVRATVDEEYRTKAVELNARYYFVLGEYLARKKDIKGALQALERARSFNEAEPEIYYSLSGVYLQLGKAEESEALLRRTLELDPKHFAAILDLAQLIKGSGSLGEVHDLFVRAAKIDPDSDEAVLGLVVIEMAGKDYRKARKSLQDFVARKPDSHLGHFYLGTLEQDLGSYALAEKHYKRALELRPDFARATAYLGQIYETQNRGDEALKLFEDAAQYVQGVSFWKRIGEIRSQRQEPKAAREAFESYLEVDKDNTEVMLRLAFLALESKDFVTAEKQFRKIAELKPEFSSAHYFIGVLLEEKKDFKGAMEWLKKVKPGTAVALDAVKAMARIYAQTDDLDKGWDLLKKTYDDNVKLSKADREKLSVEMVHFLSKAKRHDDAIKFADEAKVDYPASEELLYARSVAMEDSGRALQGAKEIEYLIEKKRTKNAAILNFVGYIYADEGVNLAKAESYVRQAQKLNPNDPYISDSLGWVLFKRGDYRGAEVWLRRAVKAVPNEAVVLEHLADCLVKLGAMQEATELYARALEKGHKKESDQQRLRAKHRGLTDKLQVSNCAGNSADTACRVVRDPRSPASASH